MSKFNNVTVEPDTIILFSLETLFGEYDVLYQKWKWDSISAESLIFSNQDVSDISIDDLKKEIQQSPLLLDPDNEITTSKNKDYTFFNYNFDYD